MIGFNFSKPKDHTMLFYPERLRSRRWFGIFQNPLQIILLGGFLFFGFPLQYFDTELGAQYDANRAPAPSKFAFAPRGFGAYLAEELAKDRHAMLTPVSMEAPLTGSNPNAAPANLLIINPDGNERGENGSHARVRIINGTLSGYSNAPVDITAKVVNKREAKKTQGAVKAARLQEVEPYSTKSSWLANNSMENAGSSSVSADQESGRVRLQPDVARPRRVSRRSKRVRAPAKRPSVSVGPFSDLPEWARVALFKAGE